MSNETMTVRGKEMRRQILDRIVSYIQEHGYPPTTREIGDMVCLDSTSSVYNHLQRMRGEGMIDFLDGQPRTITVPGYKYIKTD